MPVSDSIAAGVLTGSMLDFARPSGPDLLGRTSEFEAWRRARSEAGVWPFSRVLHSAPAPEMDIADEQGHSGMGVSLACQDYLGLTAHPAIRSAAARALQELGPHSAGSPALAGNTGLSLELERALGEALGYEHVVLFPTGWGAGYASIAGLVRPDDHVVLDQLSHACLQQGAMAATRKVHRHSHRDVSAMRQRLERIRAEDAENGILVVTEGLFSMDSDIPDIVALQEACRELGATLVVDVAHDFGALGPKGGGSLGMQGLLGKVDLVMGSFSKTFASNGGFIATHSEAVRQYLKFYGSPQTFSNALSPVQTAVVLEALRIVRSPEGDSLRAALLENADTLRSALAERGIRCIGSPSAIVPAHVGDEAVGRLAWSAATARGVHVNLVEFPAVAVKSARFRMQLMSTHRREQILHAATVVAEALDEAHEQARGISLPSRCHPATAPRPEAWSTVARALPSLETGDLEKLAARARMEARPAGCVLIQEGQHLDTLFIVRRGSVRVEVDHQGHPFTLAELGEGQILGEMSMLDGRGASATVVAVTDVEVASLDHATLNHLAVSDPALGMRLYRSLATILDERLRTSNRGVSPYEFVG